MSLRTTLGLSRESSLEEGTPDEVAEKKRIAHEAILRPARLEVARRNARWHELEEVDLVPRHRGWLVSATTDEVFTRYRGVVWAADTVGVLPDRIELWFYVSADDEIRFLERVNPPATWTEHLEQQAERARRKAAPKPRRVPAE